MNWRDDGRDSLFYSGSDTLPNLIHSYTWNQDSGQYIHTIIQDSLRWELAWDFGIDFFPSDNIYYEGDSLGVFQNTGRRFTTGPSGRIESQMHMYNFPGSGFDTVTAWPNIMRIITPQPGWEILLNKCLASFLILFTKGNNCISNRKQRCLVL